jgi:hypothetical protein
MQNYKTTLNLSLLTGGGRIFCLRCTAKSKRSGLQCGRPASKGSKSQKCHMHGGRGTSGPKTEEGRKRVAAANTKTGEFTKAAKLEVSRCSARLAQLEDAMHVLGMTTATRTRGRKSAHYVPVTSVEDVRAMMIDTVLHSATGSSEGLKK